MLQETVVEGYYLVLRDGSIWSVKGCCHEERGVVAVPRLVGGVKIKRLGESLDYVYRNYRGYLKKTCFSVREIPVVPLEDVSKILEPSRGPCREAPRRLYETTTDLLETLSSQGLEAYVTGSLLYCRAEESSDIDIVFYERLEKARETIERLVHERVLERLGRGEVERVVAEVGEGLDERSHKMLLERSLHELVYRGQRVSIRYVDCGESVRETVCDAIERSSLYSGALEIVDGSRGYTTPSIYRVLARGSGGVYTAYSHRMRLAGLMGGDVIEYSGVLEETVHGYKRLNLDMGRVSIVSLAGRGQRLLSMSIQ